MQKNFSRGNSHIFLTKYKKKNKSVETNKKNAIIVHCKIRGTWLALKKPEESPDCMGRRTG